jgi:hypothetical protein
MDYLGVKKRKKHKNEYNCVMADFIICCLLFTRYYYGDQRNWALIYALDLFVSGWKVALGFCEFGNVFSGLISSKVFKEGFWLVGC